MKKILSYAFFIFFFNGNAQIQALTEDGKEVVLFENKTWRFKNESDDKLLETITTNPEVFSKDNNSTFLFKSKKINAGIYVNPKLWKVNNYLQAPYVEYIFQNTDNDQLIGMIVSEKIEIPTLKNLKDIQIAAIQKKADFFKLEESEYRNVNGLKVLYMSYIANTKGMDFKFINYYYLTEEGYFAVSSYTLKNNFDKHKTSMERFINGIVAIEIKEKLPPPAIKN